MLHVFVSAGKPGDRGRGCGRRGGCDEGLLLAEDHLQAGGREVHREDEGAGGTIIIIASHLAPDHHLKGVMGEEGDNLV